jgi:hypothetical protein
VKFNFLVSHSKWNKSLKVKEKIIALKAKINHMKKGDQIPRKVLRRTRKNPKKGEKP